MSHRHHHAGLQGRRPLPGRLRPQGDRAGRARDARPDADPRGVRRRPAAQGRAHHRLAAHDRPDRRADRDAHRARRRGALVLVQHLLDPGPRRRRRGRRARGHPRGPAGRARCSPGRARRSRSTGGAPSRSSTGPRRARQHDPRRRRRRHDARPQGQSSSRRPAPCRTPPTPSPRSSRSSCGLLERSLAEDSERYTKIGRGDQGRDRGDHHRRPPPLPARRDRRPAVPGDQRERLGHQVEVRQPLRLPPLAGRRHQPRDRRDDRRQGRRGLRLRRRGQGLRRLAAGAGRPRDRHRDRPDLRAAGVHGGLRGQDARGRASRPPTSSSPPPATRTSSPPTTWRG